MYSEELIEEGFVKRVTNGFAEILISNSDKCEECTAKVYCKPGGSSDRTLIVKDPYGVLPGDKVRVSISGSKILFTSIFIYGIPLLLLIIGILIGYEIFSHDKELNSTLFAFGLVFLYGVITYIVTQKRKVNSYPVITFVSSNRNN